MGYHDGELYSKFVGGENHTLRCTTEGTPMFLTLWAHSLFVAFFHD